MSFEDGFFLACVACIIPWLLAGWLRLPRYARYLQEEGYDSERYTNWHSHSTPEIRYVIVFVCGLVLLTGFSCIGSLFISSILTKMPFLPVIGYLAVALLAICFAPHNRRVGQEFISTSKTIRLLITAFFVEFVPILIGAWLISGTYNALYDPNNSPEAMFAVGIFFLGFMILITVCVGPITFILTPYLLLIAHAINRPIETIFARGKH